MVLTKSIITGNENYPRPEVTRACHITMLVATIALSVVVLICQVYPGAPITDFFAKNQITLLSVAGGVCCITLALHIITLCRKQKPEVLAKALPVDPQPLASVEKGAAPIALPTTQSIIPIAQPLKHMPMVRAVHVDEPLAPLDDGAALPAKPATPQIAPPPQVKKLRAVHIMPPPNLVVQQEKVRLRKEAESRITQAKKQCKQVNWNQFALMNNTSLIKDSSYDRGLTREASLLAHFNYLQFLKTEGLFFAMDETVLEDVMKTMDAVEEMVDVRNAHAINDKLEKNGTVYALLGYCGNRSEDPQQNIPGHSVACKLKKDAEHVTIYFLNLGEGVQHTEYHPQLNATETQIKISRCTHPSQIPVEDWEHAAEAFISSLARFQTDVPDKKAPYSSWELYQLQSALAPPNPALLLPFAVQMEGKPQYVGDCSDKAVRNVLIDFLAVEKHLAEDQIGTFFLNLHLASLFFAFHSYQHSPEPHRKELLIHGIEEFANFLLRSKPFLKEHDYLLAGEMLDVILSEIKTDPEMPQTPLATNHIPAPSTLFAQIKPPPTKLIVFDLCQRTRYTCHPVKLPSFDPYLFKRDLKEALRYDPPSVIAYISSLPVPQWANPDDPWNTVPSEDIPGIVSYLTQFERNILHSIMLEGETALCVFTLYAIVDKLARRNPLLTKLKGFASPFAVDKTEGCLTFRAGIQEHRYQQIKAYFSNNHKDAKGKILFPITHLLQFSQYRLQRLQGEDSPATHILDYLDQFTDSPSPDYATLWKNLSPEMHALYFFAYSADLLGNGRLQKLGDEERKLITAPLAYHHHCGGSLKIARKSTTWIFNSDGLELQDQFLTFQKDSTNEVLCRSTHSFAKLKRGLLAYHGKRTTPELTNDLTLLHQHPELKIGLAIPWMRTHRPDLNHTIVQESLEECFFSPGVLREHLTAMPETVAEVRQLIQESLTEYRNQQKHISAILFLIRFAITFEDYVSVILEQPIDQKTLGMYEKYVKPLLAELKWGNKKDEKHYAQVRMHYLYLRLSMQPEISEEVLIELYTHLCVFNAAQGSWYRDWYALWRGSLAVTRLEKFSEQFDTFLRSLGDREQATLNAICNQILTSLLGERGATSENWQWSSPGVCYSDQHIINFHTGSVHLLGYVSTLTFLSHGQREWLNTSEYQLDAGSLWWKVGIHRTLDREHGYLSLDQTSVLYRDGIGKKPSQLYHVNRVRLMGDMIAHNHKHVQSKDNQALYFLRLLPLSLEKVHPSSVICFHRNTKQPFVRITSDSEGTTITRLDDKGDPLPYKLANLKELDPRHPLFAYTLQIAPYDELLCFVHETTGEIEELHFPILKIILTNREGTLVDASGFSFTKMPIRTLGSLAPHVMVLRKDKGNIKLILPAPQAKLRLESKKDKKKFRWTKSMIYHLKSSDEEIRFTSLSEQLFFVYFFKAHGDYTRAYQELKKMRNLTFDSKNFDFLSQFFSIPDYSSTSLAFNLRLILLVVDHFHLMDAPTAQRACDFLKCHIHCYVDYLRFTEEDHYNAISCEWRLSEEEESRILTACIREGIELTKILQIREEMLHTEERSAILELEPQYGPSFAFSDVMSPQQLEPLLNAWHRVPSEPSIPFILNPHRVPENYVYQHFFTLFAQAKEARFGHTDPFDFTLLALLKHDKKELASLLFYVRHFPYHFKGINFSHEHMEQSDKKNFETLVHTAMQLELTPEFQEFQQKVLNHVAQFDYKKVTTLTLPPLPPPPQSLPTINSWDIDEKPFVAMCGTLFEQQEGTSFEGLSLFDDSLIAGTPLAQELLQSYQTAHATLSNQKPSSYVFKSDKIDSVNVQIKNLHKHHLHKMESSKNRILKYLNDPFGSFYSDFTVAQEREFHLSLNAHQLYLISPEMVMQEAILKDSTALFDEHRPMLQAQHIQAIIEEVHHYYHLQVLTLMCADALKCLAALKENLDQPLVQKELFDILNYTFLYVPEDYPEIGYMKVQTGKLPRPEQIAVYLWICEGLALYENRLFQLPAGGGKTSYLIPLMTLRSKKLKLMPAILTTQAMYPTEKENLGHTLSLLGQELDTLDVGMQTVLSFKKLQIIHQTLKKNLQKGSALIVTPQTFYALRLLFFTASVEDADGANTKLLHKILGLFKNHGLILGDESHRNFNPLTQAVFGVGTFAHLEHGELSLLFTLMQTLLKMPPEDNIEKIKNTLASLISDQPEVISFLTHKKATEPDCLASGDAHVRYLALMTRYFLNSLLPKIRNMKTDFDHVYSQEQGEIDTPAYHKTPSHAQFKDPYLTFALTVKGTWHRGLNDVQLRALIRKLKAMDRDEEFLVVGNIATPSQKKFHGWTQSQFPNLSLRDVNLENENSLKEVFAHLKHQPDVIEYYLFLMVHSRIGYSSEQFTSTPAHLMEMGKCSVIFSATPLTRIAYPQSLKEAQYDPLFEAKVIAQASKKKNQNFIFPKDGNAFFADLENNREHLSHVRYMIDADGFLCHEENGCVAKRWLEASSLEGVIYFKEGENLALLLRDGRLIEFKGTNDLQHTLAAYDISWDRQAIGVFLDAQHAESANFPPIPHSAAYILSGRSLTLSHTIQSIMRERGFLDDSIDQRIIWVIPESLMIKQGVSSEGFHSRTLFSWLLNNEVKAYKSTILMAAFQEIAFKIESLGLNSSDDRSHYIHKHAAGFKEQAHPTQAWESHEKSEITSLFLRQFATEYYDRFHFEIPYKAQTSLNAEIEEIIMQVEKKIAQIAVNFHTRTATEVHQKCMLHAHEEIQKVQYRPNPLPITPEQLRPHTPLTDPNYLLSLKPKHAVRSIFKTPHLTEHFYLEPNQLHTARRLDHPLKEKFLKRIDFILIIIQGDQVYAQAVSHDVAIHHLKSLKNPPSAVHLEHQAFMIRADGVLYQSGMGVLAPTVEKRNAILSSTWLQDVLIDAALLKGQILNDNDRFSERVKKWPQFHEFWKKILKALPFPREYSLQSMLSFMPSESNHVFITQSKGEQK